MLLNNEYPTDSVNQNHYIGRLGKDYFHHRKHPWFVPIMIVIIIVILLGVLFIHEAYNDAQGTFHTTYQSGEARHSRDASKLLKNNKPFSVLLLGTDTGALGRNDKGRTDTMILATVNPDQDRIFLTSIPRDTKVSIPGDSSSEDKINNAYTIGGPSQAMSSVQNLLHVPVDYYALVNMGGLEKMVNAVNGVKVNPPLSFKYEAANVKKDQPINLHGTAALDYSRMRHQDPKGDFGRQIRQRQVLQKLIMKGIKLESLPRYRQILSSLHGNLITDMKFSDMVTIRYEYVHTTRHIDSQSLDEKGEVDNGIDYEVPIQSKLNHQAKEIRKSLEIS